MKFSTTLALAAVAGFTEAFQLNFYIGRNCRSAHLGSFDSGFHTCGAVPVNSASVVITENNPSDPQRREFASMGRQNTNRDDMNTKTDNKMIQRSTSTTTPNLAAAPGALITPARSSGRAATTSRPGPRGSRHNTWAPRANGT
jgi:hypothetical protein